MRYLGNSFWPNYQQIMQFRIYNLGKTRYVAEDMQVYGTQEIELTQDVTLREMGASHVALVKQA